MVGGGIGGVERLGHVQAVQPYLAGIDLLVPEGAGLGPGLLPELSAGRFDRSGIPRIGSGLIQGNQRPGRADMVQVELLPVVFAADVPVLIQDTVIPRAYIRVEFRNGIGTGNVQETAEFQAGRIIPLVATLLAVQESGLGSPLDLGPDHPDGERFLLRGGRTGCEAAKGEKQYGLFHQRLS